MTGNCQLPMKELFQPELSDLASFLRLALGLDGMGRKLLFALRLLIAIDKIICQLTIPSILLIIFALNAMFSHFVLVVKCPC